jgi:hypothetical protein
MKLARVALDHRTPEHEAVNALKMIRSGQLDWCQMTALLIEHSGLAKAAVKPLSRHDRQADFRESRDNIRMPWGKHRGLRLDEIMADHPWYLPFILEKCDWVDGKLRERMELAVESFA